jgi:hypothetical protein
VTRGRVVGVTLIGALVVGVTTGLAGTATDGLVVVGAVVGAAAADAATL